MSDPNLLPEDLVRQIRSQSEADFIRRSTTTRYLLIRLAPSAGPDLLPWLVASSTTAGVPLAATGESIGFATSVAAISMDRILAARTEAARAKSPATRESILAELTSKSLFIAPLRKRDAEGKPFAERISVGRARNNDIVLRHASVSKFHAWFACDEDDELWLTDAKSRNQTAVAGLPMAPTDPRLLKDGIEITFGDISCILASPKLLWEVVTAAVN